MATESSQDSLRTAEPRPQGGEEAKLWKGSSGL